MEEKERRGRECMFKGIGSINEHCFGRLTKEKKETGWLITRKDVITAELNVNISELSTTSIESDVGRLALESCFNKHSARLPRSWFSRAWREKERSEEKEGEMGLES